MPDRTNSKDGIELMMQSNHLGHFLLTELLLDELKKVEVNRELVRWLLTRTDIDQVRAVLLYRLLSFPVQRELVLLKKA